MLELGTFGSVRGVSGNGHPYRNPRSVRPARRRREQSLGRRDGPALSRGQLYLV